MPCPLHLVAFHFLAPHAVVLSRAGGGCGTGTGRGRGPAGGQSRELARRVDAHDVRPADGAAGRLCPPAAAADSRWLSHRSRTIPLHGGDGPALEEALAAARAALDDGDLVCVFPEGGMTHSGQLQGLAPAFLTMAAQHGHPIVPVYLGGFWGSVSAISAGGFSGRFRGRCRIRRRSIRPAADGPCDGRTFGGQSRTWRCRPPAAASRRSSAAGPEIPPGLAAAVFSARRWLTAPAWTSGAATGRRAGDAKLLRRNVSADEPHLGAPPPPSGAAVVVNAAMTLDRRVAVNLNYTVRRRW